MKWLKRLGLGWFLFRLFGPEIPPRFAPGQEHPLRLPGRTVFVGDAEFLVREAGPADGPPLVLVHGWGDHSLAVYSHIIPLLADRFRIIAVDNRNTGKSEAVRGRYEIAQAADDLGGLLDRIGVSGAAVFGYSMGGMIVQELARRHPHVVGKLGLSGTAANPMVVDLPSPIVGFALAVARSLDRISRSEVSWVRLRYLVGVGAVEPRHARYFWTQHMARDPDLYWQAGSAIARFDSRQWIGRLGLEALIIITTHDQLMPPAAQYELASLIPGATVVELAGARHEAPLTHAAPMAAAIAEWAQPS